MFFVKYRIFFASVTSRTIEYRRIFQASKVAIPEIFNHSLQRRPNSRWIFLQMTLRFCWQHYSAAHHTCGASQAQHCHHNVVSCTPRSIVQYRARQHELHETTASGNYINHSRVATTAHHSGHCDVLHTGVLHSGVLLSGLLHSSVSQRGVFHSSVLHSDVLHSGVLHTGVLHSVG